MATSKLQTLGELFGVQDARQVINVDRSKEKYGFVPPQEYLDLLSYFGRGRFIAESLNIEIFDILHQSFVQEYQVAIDIMLDCRENDPDRPMPFPSVPGLFPFGWANMGVTISWLIDEDKKCDTIVTSYEDQDYFARIDVISYLHNLVFGKYSANGVSCDDSQDDAKTFEFRRYSD